MEQPLFKDEKHDAKAMHSSLEPLDDLDTTSSLKVHFHKAPEDDDEDDDDLKLGLALSKEHKSSSAVNAELTTSMHNQEHVTIPDVVAASITPSANRSPPPLPNPLTPTTRVVKRPASLRATNRRPGAYSIDGMDASTDGSRDEDFDEYDSVSPMMQQPSQELRSSRVIPTGGIDEKDESPVPMAAHDEKQPPRISTRVIMIVLVVLVVIGVAVGVGVGVGGQGSSSSSSASSSTASGTTGRCNFTGQEQPNIFLQCNCSRRVGIISPALSQSYQSLLVSLVPEVVLDFHEATDSCSPTNQALLWLANDTTAGSDSIRLTNRFVLVRLYVTWGGPGWQYNEGWATPTDECSWYGVACEQQVITQLSLCNNSFAANSTIPSELFALTGLVSLTLAGNAIAGPFPALISKLAKLEYLNIANNELTGSFPFSDLVSLTDLAGFDFSNNFLSGTLPNSIGQLTNLNSLLGSTNLISGTIPTELALATKLAFFDMLYNAFTGNIPSEVGRLTNLERLTIGGPLSGTVPTELGRLLKLRVLAITSQASMVGPIPTELGSLSKLETLGLVGNHHTGSIPTFLGKCVRLAVLNLQRNALTGTIPKHLGLIPSLEIFDASFNNLHGEIPSNLFHRPLQILNLASNDLSGSLPSNVGNARLECLDVTSNNLTEVSPTKVCQQVGPTLQHAGVDCPAQQQSHTNSTGMDGCPCCNCVNACLEWETSAALQSASLQAADTCSTLHPTNIT